MKRGLYFVYGYAFLRRFRVAHHLTEAECGSEANTARGMSAISFDLRMQSVSLCLVLELHERVNSTRADDVQMGIRLDRLPSIVKNVELLSIRRELLAPLRIQYELGKITGSLSPAFTQNPSYDVAMAPLIELRGLTVEIPTPAGWIRPVDDVSFALEAGESLGLVGESGSGKSMLALALMGLLPPGARVRGEAWFSAPPASGQRERRRRVAREFAHALRARTDRRARARHRHDFSGADDGAQSRHARGRANCRSDSRASCRAFARGSRSPRPRGARTRRRARACHARAPVSAPALGRLAPARHDCDGARGRQWKGPAPAHRR